MSKSSDPVSLAEKRWLSISEAVEWSGLSTRTLYRLFELGRLRTHRPTGEPRSRVLIDRHELDRLIELSGTVATAAACG